MGLEFDHPQGAKFVMKRLYENGVWAIFSTLDPRRPSVQARGADDALRCPRNCWTALEVAVGKAAADARSGRNVR